jgi:predicted NBD/HSP70 family sugar kinase
MSGSPVLRRLNAQAVLDALLTGGPQDATQLMTVTGLSRPTVHSVGDDLISRDLVTEHTGPPVTGPGRRARWYSLRAGAAHVVGVDMGEAGVQAAVADLLGTVAGEAARPFPDPKVPAARRLAIVRTTVAAALERAAVPASGVRAATLGVPAPVTSDGHAVAVDAYLPGLAAADLHAALHPLLDVPVTVENDANLAVLAERWTGAAPGCDDVVLLLAGERLGAGLYAGGRLVRGFAGGAGEMGFLRLVAGVGGTDGVGRLTRLATGRPAPDVLAAAAAGEPGAPAALDAVAARIGRALAVLGTLLDPEMLVVGGAVAEAGEVLMAPLRRAYAAALHERPERSTPTLTASPLGGRGTLLGAVRSALDAVLPHLLDP